MHTVSTHLRRRFAELGRLSRPLGEERAIALAADLARTVTSELSARGNAERVLRIYEARLESELARLERSSRETSRSRPTLGDVLERFSSSEIFTVR